MKFIHDGVEFDLYKPEIDGWEFNEYRCVKYDEKYFDADFVEEWVCKRPSHSEYFIATKVEVVKPVVKGWAFLDDKPRVPKRGEHYCSTENSTVVTLALSHHNDTDTCRWIATKVKPKARKVVRLEIKSMVGGSLYVDERGTGILYIDSFIRNPDFIGLFENEDGSLHTEFISYWYTEYERYIKHPAFLADIESGKVEVHHAKFALFFE